MKKILITTSSFDLSNFTDISSLRNAGFEVQCNPFGKRLTEEQISNLMDDQVIAMIAGTEPLTESVMVKAPGLKIIVRCGIGLDNVDMEAAQNFGIKVFNTPDAPTRSVAELTLGHILSLLRRIAESDRLIRAAKWQSLMGSLLFGQTVGVIGFGRIGKMVSQLLIAFGAKVLVYDVYPQLGFDGVEIVTKERIFAESDILTLHLPYTKENHHLINAETFAQMKPGAFIVNVSRGGLIDDTALYEAIKNKSISGAALDCFEQEPYQGPLAGCEEVQLTAHMGSYASQSRVKQEQDSCEVLVRELKSINLI
jgi:D-3-phosphoglycerate dehydrogenase